MLKAAVERAAAAAADDVGGRRTVYVKCVFLKIEDINTVQEQFTALVWLRARWREPKLDGKTARGEDGKAPDVTSRDDLWTPKLELANLFGQPSKMEMWRTAETKDGRAYVVERRRVKAKFTEKMELENFPFDLQDLTLLLSSSRPVDEVEMREDPEDPSALVTNSFVDASEFRLMNFVHVQPRTLEDEFQAGPPKPALMFQCMVARRFEFFILNSMFVLAMLTTLSFVTFAIDYTLTFFRVNLSFILLLASVTFKFSASKSVPKISYLTHLDRYILGSMAYLFSVAGWHAGISLISATYAYDADEIAFFAFFSLYIGLHAGFILFTVASTITRRRAAGRKERDYKERCMSLNQPMRRLARAGLWASVLAQTAAASQTSVPGMTSFVPVIGKSHKAPPLPSRTSTATPRKVKVKPM